MHAVLRQYGLSIALSLLVVAASSVAGWVVAGDNARNGKPVLVPTARVLAIGAVLLILAATALPYTWPPRLLGDGDVILTFGRGGLADWRAVIHNPDSAHAILFVANVLLYIPLTLFATIGWRRRRIAILAGSLALSCLIEVVQFTWLGRVAAVDDVFLNMVGAVVGCLAGSVIAAGSSALEDRRHHS
jgi:glycopeptide antibiotics resistance protein